MSEIPFWVHDRPKWVSGITKSTTCADVLQALVIAERKSKKELSEPPEEAREISKNLALVEQWRGVERPLSNSSKILKLWLAWGEERSQVRFVVKRISAQQQRPNSRSARPRRRNSRANSIQSDTKKYDTLHPSALNKPDLEKLMRIILTQGETIHWQLKKLQEREGQIESIEQEVHQTRTKTAGKDYLLNAYLAQSDKKKDIEATTESLQEVLEALSKICSLNEQIFDAEEKAADLNLKVSNTEGIEGLQSELKDLRTVNDQAGREIDNNRHLISSMRLAYDERKALMAQLEKDVDTIELEGKRLQKELQALTTNRQEKTFDILSQFLSEPDEVLDEVESENSSPIIFSGGFLDSEKNNGHYDTNILTSEQLYEGCTEPGALYDELQRRLRIKTTISDLGLSPNESRIKATGSPGSNSSSGNSSGSGASYEKSVRFNDRQLILSTPELPDLGPTSQSIASKKSILKPGENGQNGQQDNTDSNSDTGLSSLHSSSDEGTYVLDTLV